MMPDTSPTWPLRRLILGMAVAVAVGGCSSTPVEHPAGQPLQHMAQGKPVDPVVWGFRESLPAGGIRSIGLPDFFNTSSKPLTITDVRPVVEAAGVDVLGAIAVTPDRTTGVSTAAWEQFPPQNPALGTQAPAKGFAIPPNHGRSNTGYGIIVGYRATGVARATILAVDIDYTVDGKHYTYVEPAFLSMCAPPTTPEDCTPPVKES